MNLHLSHLWIVSGRPLRDETVYLHGEGGRWLAWFKVGRWTLDVFKFERWRWAWSIGSGKVIWTVRIGMVEWQFCSRQEPKT